MARDRKEPLYRRDNTTARGARRDGGDYRHARNTKDERGSDAKTGRMQRRNHGRPGRDYTPLFRFLLSKVGDPWAEVHSEAVARLDREEPIYWMVAIHDAERKARVRIGDSTYFSGLYVDAAGTLQLVDPTLDVSTMEPSCGCCTHTFNGMPFTRPWPGGR